MALVVLNASHGGNDVGGFYLNRMEKNDNLRLTFAVGEILSYSGVEVKYTRVTDTNISPIDRVRIINAFEGDLLVDFHRGYPTPGRETGVAAYVFQDYGIAVDAAQIVLNNLEEIGFFNNGIGIRSAVYLLRNSNLPAFELVVGYLDSDYDNNLFDTQFNAIANAIADGIIEALKQYGIMP